MDDIDEKIDRTVDCQHQMTDIYNSFNSLGWHATITTLWTDDDFVKVRDDFAALTNDENHDDHYQGPGQLNFFLFKIRVRIRVGIDAG